MVRRTAIIERERRARGAGERTEGLLRENRENRENRGKRLMRRRSARRARRAAALVLMFVLTCLATGGGCLGHIMGWSDAEVEKLRLIVAELEAKNAALVEENLALRKRLSEKPDAGKEAARLEDGIEE